MMCALRDLAAQDARARALRLRVRRGVRGGRRSAAPTTWSSRATSATSRSPASPPTCTSASRPRACWPCASRSRGTAAHGSTPWMGDNAVLKAIDVFRQIESLPFARESSDLFDRPSINLGRIVGGDALNKVPDLLRDRRGRALPARARTPRRSCAAVDALPDATVVKVFHRQPGDRRARQPLRAGARRGDRARGAAGRRADLGRPRRRLGRDLVPRGRRARRWSAARPATATTAPRSGCRSGRSASIGRRSWSS